MATSADLAITKEDFPDPVVAGAGLTYQVTITNNGPSTAADVLLEDSLPAEVSYLSATISGGGLCVLLAVPPNTVSCELGDIDPQAASLLLRMQPQQRDEMLRGLRQGGPKGYRQLIRDYFVRLSEVDAR